MTERTLRFDEWREERGEAAEVGLGELCDQKRDHLHLRTEAHLRRASEFDRSRDRETGCAERLGIEQYDLGVELARFGELRPGRVGHEDLRARLLQAVREQTPPRGVVRHEQEPQSREDAAGGRIGARGIAVDLGRGHSVLGARIRPPGRIVHDLRGFGSSGPHGADPRVRARLAPMKVPPLGMSTDEARAELDRLRHPVRIAIDRAKNGFNVGAMIRTAHSFLVREIVLIGDEPWYERAAMGMHRFEHVVEVPTVEAFLERVRSEGLSLSVFEKDHATVRLWDAVLPQDAVLVFGNEDVGVDERILETASEIVAIPMYGVNHSYPVTVACGIALAEWARRHAS